MRGFTHLLQIGIMAAQVVLVGDTLLGWDMHDPAKPVMEVLRYDCLNLTDGGFFESEVPGLMGAPPETLCTFAVNRLFVTYSPRSADLVHCGIPGIPAFGR